MATPHAPFLAGLVKLIEVVVMLREFFWRRPENGKSTARGTNQGGCLALRSCDGGGGGIGSKLKVALPDFQHEEYISQKLRV